MNMTAIDLIVYDCYQDGMTVDQAFEVLCQANFHGYTWEDVADLYEGVYCKEGGGSDESSTVTTQCRLAEYDSYGFI